MSLTAYVLLFVLLTVVTLECRAQVNVFDVKGGGGADIQGLSSSNEGSQVANTINNSGRNTPQQTTQNLRRTHARNRPYRPNGSFGPNRNFDPNGFSDANGLFDPNSYFDPNRSFDPNSSFDPNRSFDPNSSYDPNSSFGVNEYSGLYRNFRPNGNQANEILIPYTIWRPEFGYYYYQYGNPHLYLQGQQNEK